MSTTLHRRRTNRTHQDLIARLVLTVNRLGLSSSDLVDYGILPNRYNTLRRSHEGAGPRVKYLKQPEGVINFLKAFESLPSPAQNGTNGTTPHATTPTARKMQRGYVPFTTGVPFIKRLVTVVDEKNLSADELLAFDLKEHTYFNWRGHVQGTYNTKRPARISHESLKRIKAFLDKHESNKPEIKQEPKPAEPSPFFAPRQPAPHTQLVRYVIAVTLPAETSFGALREHLYGSSLAYEAIDLLDAGPAK